MSKLFEKFSENINKKRREDADKKHEGEKKFGINNPFEKFSDSMDKINKKRQEDADKKLEDKIRRLQNEKLTREFRKQLEEKSTEEEANQKNKPLFIYENEDEYTDKSKTIELYTIDEKDDPETMYDKMRKSGIDGASLNYFDPEEQNFYGHYKSDDDLPGIVVLVNGKQYNRKQFEKYIEAHRDSFRTAYNEAIIKRALELQKKGYRVNVKAELPKEKEEKKETELEDTLPFDGKEAKKIGGIGKDMYQSKYLSDEDKTKTKDINNKIRKNLKSKNKGKICEFTHKLGDKERLIQIYISDAPNYIKENGKLIENPKGPKATECKSTGVLQFRIDGENPYKYIINGLLLEDEEFLQKVFDDNNYRIPTEEERQKMYEEGKNSPLMTGIEKTEKEQEEKEKEEKKKNISFGKIVDGKQIFPCDGKVNNEVSYINMYSPDENKFLTSARELIENKLNKSKNGIVQVNLNDDFITLLDEDEDFKDLRYDVIDVYRGYNKDGEPEIQYRIDGSAKTESINDFLLYLHTKTESLAMSRDIAEEEFVNQLISEPDKEDIQSIVNAKHASYIINTEKIFPYDGSSTKIENPTEEETKIIQMLEKEQENNKDTSLKYHYFDNFIVYTGMNKNGEATPQIRCKNMNADDSLAEFRRCVQQKTKEKGIEKNPIVNGIINNRKTPSTDKILKMENQGKHKAKSHSQEQDR